MFHSMFCSTVESSIIRLQRARRFVKMLPEIETVKRVLGCYSMERIVLHRSFTRLKWNQISRFARNSREARRDVRRWSARGQHDLRSFNCSLLSSAFTENVSSHGNSRDARYHVDAKKSKNCKEYIRRLALRSPDRNSLYTFSRRVR